MQFVLCRKDKNWICCLAKVKDCGRLLIGERKKDGTMEVMYYDLDETELIAMGTAMVELGKELIVERRSFADDVTYIG